MSTVVVDGSDDEDDLLIFVHGTWTETAEEELHIFPCRDPKTTTRPQRRRRRRPRAREKPQQQELKARTSASAAVARPPPPPKRIVATARDESLWRNEEDNNDDNEEDGVVVVVAAVVDSSNSECKAADGECKAADTEAKEEEKVVTADVTTIVSSSLPSSTAASAIATCISLLSSLSLSDEDEAGVVVAAAEVMDTSDGECKTADAKAKEDETTNEVSAAETTLVSSSSLSSSSTAATDLPSLQGDVVDFSQTDAKPTEEQQGSEEKADSDKSVEDVDPLFNAVQGPSRTASGSDKEEEAIETQGILSSIDDPPKERDEKEVEEEKKEEAYSDDDAVGDEMDSSATAVLRQEVDAGAEVEETMKEVSAGETMLGSSSSLSSSSTATTDPLSLCGDMAAPTGEPEEPEDMADSDKYVEDVNPSLDAVRGPSRTAGGLDEGYESNETQGVLSSVDDPLKEREEEEEVEEEKKEEAHSDNYSIGSEMDSPAATELIHCSRTGSATARGNDDWASRPVGRDRDDSAVRSGSAEMENMDQRAGGSHINKEQEEEGQKETVLLPGSPTPPSPKALPGPLIQPSSASAPAAATAAEAAFSPTATSITDAAACSPSRKSCFATARDPIFLARWTVSKPQALYHHSSATMTAATGKVSFAPKRARKSRNVINAWVRPVARSSSAAATTYGTTSEQPTLHSHSRSHVDREADFRDAELFDVARHEKLWVRVGILDAIKARSSSRTKKVIARRPHRYGDVGSHDKYVQADSWKKKKRKKAPATRTLSCPGESSGRVTRSRTRTGSAAAMTTSAIPSTDADTATSAPSNKTVPSQPPALSNDGDYIDTDGKEDPPDLEGMTASPIGHASGDSPGLDRRASWRSAVTLSDGDGEKDDDNNNEKVRDRSDSTDGMKKIESTILETALGQPPQEALSGLVERASLETEAATMSVSSASIATATAVHLPILHDGDDKAEEDCVLTEASSAWRLSQPEDSSRRVEQATQSDNAVATGASSDDTSPRIMTTSSKALLPLSKPHPIHPENPHSPYRAMSDNDDDNNNNHPSDSASDASSPSTSPLPRPPPESSHEADIAATQTLFNTTHGLNSNFSAPSAPAASTSRPKRRTAEAHVESTSRSTRRRLHDDQEIIVHVRDPNQDVLIEETAFLYHDPLEVGQDHPLEAGVLSADLPPLSPPAPILSTIPSGLKCKWTILPGNERVVVANFGNHPIIPPADRKFFAALAERNDLVLIAEGILPDSWTSEFVLEHVRRTLGFRVYDKIRRFDRNPDDGTSKEREDHTSMRVTDYFRYLEMVAEVRDPSPETSPGPVGTHKKVEDLTFTYVDPRSNEPVRVNVRDTTLYMSDVDMYESVLDDDFKTDFKLRGWLPSSTLDLTHAKPDYSRSFMGPNAFITPPGGCTPMHHDGNGTVNSVHISLSGYHEAVMLRRLPERHKVNAMEILSPDSENVCNLWNYSQTQEVTMQWPTNDQINELDAMGYAPARFILGPGSMVIIGTGRLHCFRTMTSEALPDTDAHHDLRRAWLASDKFDGNTLCVRMSYNRMFMGSSAEAINRELAAMLEAALVCRRRSVDYLATPEFALWNIGMVLQQMILAEEENGDHLGERDFRVCRGILPSLRYLVCREFGPCPTHPITEFQVRESDDSVDVHTDVDSLHYNCHKCKFGLANTYYQHRDDEMSRLCVLCKNEGVGKCLHHTIHYRVASANGAFRMLQTLQRKVGDDEVPYSYETGVRLRIAENRFGAAHAEKAALLAKIMHK